jgi:ribose/xylose/arabinose/galactoside ABC-type transport system permease subunit
MFISIIFLAVVIAYRAREKRVLKAFLISAGLAFSFLTVLALVMIVVLLINNIDLSSATLVLSYNTFISVLLTGIIVYSLAILLCFILTHKEFKKGVNVD